MINFEVSVIPKILPSSDAIIIDSSMQGHEGQFTFGSMMSNSEDMPPWGSKGRLNRAGAKIRTNQPLSPEESLAVDAWRASHSYVLNTFKPLLWRRVKGKSIIVAQRLKRRTTIADKLLREPGMELARMDDIAGCRLIFEDIPSLEKFRREFHASKFKHKLKHADEDRYNYIKTPKESGYRGVHEIYVYEVNNAYGKKLNGLYIEMQFRTLSQHAWATAVEIISRITENQPKFNRGDERHKEFFRLSSEIIARTHEGEYSCRAELSDQDVCARLIGIDSEINVMRFLRTLPLTESF